MKERKLLVKILILTFIILSPFQVKAEEYLPIKYTQIRYSQSNGKGTTIWYSIIPGKYKMHYAYGNDKIGSFERPTTAAKRHNATLAVNTQYMGLVDLNGKILGKNTDVSKYDFYLKPNTKDSETKANVYAVDPSSTSVGINLAYALEPRWCEGMCFITMIRNGTREYKDENNYKGTTDLTGGRHPRTWIAIDSKGNQFVAVSAGRDEPLNGNNFSLKQAGLTFNEIIDVTKKYFTSDIKYLYNLDGGGSSAFVYKNNMLNPKYDNNFTTERAVAGIFYWKVDNYSISYNLNGGSLNNKSNPTEYNVDSADLTLNNPTKSGYIFTGWTGSNGETAQTTVTIKSGSNGNKNYIANWSKVIEEHTITFDTKNGNSIEKIIYKDGEAIQEPEKPNKEGYIFVGWYEDEDYTKKFDFNNLINKDIVLYAKWEKIENNLNNDINKSNTNEPTKNEIQVKEVKTKEPIINNVLDVKQETKNPTIIDVPNTSINEILEIKQIIGILLIIISSLIIYNNKAKEIK